MISRGSLTETIFPSVILRNERRIWVFTPKVKNLDSNTAVNCLIELDGWGYLNLKQFTTILDNLHAAGEIRPTITIFVDSLDMETRLRELLFHDPFNKFLIHELLPLVRPEYPITSDPCRVAMAGASVGGVAAFYTSMSQPEVCGCVLAQSPALAFLPPREPEPEGISHQSLRAKQPKLNTYFDTGILENNTLRPSGSRPRLLSCA